MHIVTGVLIGCAAGFIIGFFGKCTGGACPMTGNPYLSTIIGGLMGFIMTAGR